MKNMMDQSDLKAIKAVFIGLLAGENRMNGRYRPVFDESGTKAFLDWVKQNRPEVFRDPELILDLLYSLPRVEPFCAPEDESFLVNLFRDYLDLELKCFLQALFAESCKIKM